MCKKHNRKYRLSDSVTPPPHPKKKKVSCEQESNPTQTPKKWESPHPECEPWLMRGHVAASCYIPLVSFSAGSRLGRRGCAAVRCCAAQLLTSDWILSPPSISPLVPRKDGRVYLRWAPLKCRENAVGRDWGDWNVGKWRVLGRRWGLQLKDCRNLPTCRRDHSLTGALLEWRKKWTRKLIHSATELTAAFALLILNSKTSQSRSSKDRTNSLTRVRVPFFLSARRGILAPAA